MSDLRHRRHRLAGGAWRLQVSVAMVVLLAARGHDLQAGDVPCAELPAAGELVTAELFSSAVLAPVGVLAPRGDTERLFVVEQAGRIQILDVATGAKRPEAFLDIHLRVRSGGERGLLGLAFHPDYAQNGYFYVYYSRVAGAICQAGTVPGCRFSQNHESVISRFEVSAGTPDLADPESEKEILSFCEPFSNHNGGWIGFGPLDPYFYIATGDGGSRDDPCDSGQRGDSLLGKILRIDVDIPDGALTYRIPATNPFLVANDPDDLVRDEIWALGLRNPWRCSFDSVTGDFYIGDVGQDVWEEIDFQPGTSAGGENYEWDIREGDHAHTTQSDMGAGVATPPVFEYRHTLGCSVTGGVVYRGCRMPELAGTYFFADYCSSWVRTFRMADGVVTALKEVTQELRLGTSRTIREISAFGTDGEGEVYICDLGGEVFRVIPMGPNEPPTASIVTDPASGTVAFGAGPAAITLDASASDDGDGQIDTLSFRWSKLSGPDGGDEIDSRSQAVTAVRFTLPGEYVFELELSDQLHTVVSQVHVTVVAPLFVRGEANADGITDVSDGVFILSRLFVDAGLSVLCDDALDTNDDSLVDLTDGVFLLTHLFLGGDAPPAPYPNCGFDATPFDVVGCGESTCE